MSLRPLLRLIDINPKRRCRTPRINTVNQPKKSDSQPNAPEYQNSQEDKQRHVMRRINKLTGRPGPAPLPPRSGDKKQARQRINVEVRTGRRPHPNTLPCVDCGHVWTSGERRHEYDHHLGYSAEHHHDVVVRCTRCHAHREGKATKTHCVHGHEFTADNTGLKTNGTRFCRECHRAADRGRKDAAFWRNYRLRHRNLPA